MGSELYVWVTQKVKYDTQKRVNKPPYPLPRAIAAVLTATKDSNNMLVSPGYLGKSADKARVFHNGLDELIRPLCSNDIRPLAQIGFMRTMHGRNDGEYKGYHQEILKNKGHYLSYGPSFELTMRWLDHRKMILFYSVREGQEKSFESFIKKNAVIDKTTIDEFLSLICVNAVVVGSSNFSTSTYFGRFGGEFSYGEADAILLAHEEGSRFSDFGKIIDSFGVLAASGGFGESFLGRVNDDDMVSDYSVFSKSLYYPTQSLGGDVHDYLKRIAEEAVLGVL